MKHKKRKKRIKKTPHEIKGDLYREEQFHNVRQAYKKVSNVQHYVDDKKPSTYDIKHKNTFKSIKEKYADIEHLRTLKAMSQRILSIGKMHERRKNRYDPISNPTYFFMNALGKRDPKNEATKLISLKNLNEEKMNKENTKENKENINIDNLYETQINNLNNKKSGLDTQLMLYNKELEELSGEAKEIEDQKKQERIKKRLKKSIEIKIKE